MAETKKIASIQVVKAGSPPDIDSDFATYCRDLALEHCEELYGRGTLANIITFSTLAAKGAFKAMCTIYNTSFAEANKIAALVPGPIEGVECTIADIFDPDSPRYNEGSDFRTATAGMDWEKIIEGARFIEGKNKATGVHPCGVIISSKPLSEVIPLQVRQTDHRVITQWKYTDCESLGLIKFDFLGLDTVDLIQFTVEYIQKNGKRPPNMLELVHGPMDDKKTFELLARGETDGIFQLASSGVKDLLRRMRPTAFEDIVATTALYRPGPMGMLSHVKYADRKSGREKVEYPIHPEFKNSPMEKILGTTYGLCVYQEQVAQIANQIGGMTLQEGDVLRKAMGKKDKAVMAKMKPVFLAGGKIGGYSNEALQACWGTMEVFSEYGFNKSHSVAYAMNAYQAAYLKAHYPVEFMAALISQNIGRKEKVLAFLQEANRMGLKVGSANINSSDIRVAPDFTGKSAHDIIFGLSGINAVSKDMAEIIVRERDDHGPYSSVQDVLNRCMPLGVTNRKIYENLALAGAFDAMGLPRKGVVENLPALMGEAKTKDEKGSNLFDLFAQEEPASLDLTAGGEYPHVEKLLKESEVIGLYLTSHPLAHVGSLAGLRGTSVSKLHTQKQMLSTTVVGSITDVMVKRMKRGGKSVAVTLDDGTGLIVAYLNRELVRGLDKRTAQEKLKSLYMKGATEIPQDIRSVALDPNFESMDDLAKGHVYLAKVTYKPGNDENPYGARISELTEIILADDGTLPVRVRLSLPVTPKAKKDQVQFLSGLASKHPGSSSIFVAYKGANVRTPEALCQDALDGIEASAEETPKGEEMNNLVREREWPPPPQERGGISQGLQEVESLTYRKTKLTVDKTTALSDELEKALGIESFDFGIFDRALLDD